MNILIITTYFPPDSTIAAIRPYMFSKYLCKRGHKVTVLRSGEFYYSPDDTYIREKQNFNVITYMGKETPAELYIKGQYSQIIENIHEGKLKQWPVAIKKIGEMCLEPVYAIRRIEEAKKKFRTMKRTIDHLKSEKWDIVFSTYGNMENIWGGQYAAKTLKAKWIMDFRDPVVWYDDPWALTWNTYASRIQQEALKYADLCTAVSEGLKDRLLRSVPSANTVTLYNGYELDEDKDAEIISIDQKHLTFCYLGAIYGERGRALDSLLRILKSLIESGMIETDKIRFICGGREEEETKKIFSQNHMENNLKWVGYVDRKTAYRLQLESDIFLVLSWNTKSSQGILTGKFYEGIRAKKPIITVIAGKEPHSELRIVNEKYHYGYCYEESMSKEEKEKFKQDVLNIYQEKMENGILSHKPEKELVQAFRYDDLSKKLEELMISLIEDKRTAG